MAQVELSYRNWTYPGVRIVFCWRKVQSQVCSYWWVWGLQYMVESHHMLLFKKKFNRVNFKGVIDIIQPFMNEAASHLTSGRER